MNVSVLFVGIAANASAIVSYSVPFIEIAGASNIQRAVNVILDVTGCVKSYNSSPHNHPSKTYPVFVGAVGAVRIFPCPIETGSTVLPPVESNETVRDSNVQCAVNSKFDVIGCVKSN